MICNDFIQSQIIICLHTFIQLILCKRIPSISALTLTLLSIQMKAKDWQKATQLVWERQNQAATADTSKLSSFSLSKLPVDHLP